MRTTIAAVCYLVMWPFTWAAGFFHQDAREREREESMRAQGWIPWRLLPDETPVEHGDEHQDA